MEQSGPEHVDSTKTSPNERTLQVVFEVELADDCSCPLSAEESVEDVHQHVDGGVCHTDVTVADDGTTQVVHATNEVDESCLCLAFSDVGCVPRIQRADDRTVLIETYVPDRNVISELVDRLKSATERVSLRRLTRREGADATTAESTTIDLSHLTTKQREAAMIAVSEGYYQTPRETSLDDLAGALGISKSALSQRLNSVESKLATAAFDP